MMPAGRGQAARLLRLLILCAAGGWVLGAGGGEEEVRAMVGEVCGLILSDETPPGATAGGGAAWVGPTGRGDMQRRCRVTMHRLKLMPPRGALGAGSKGMKLPNWGMPGCEVERKFSGGKRCVLDPNCTTRAGSCTQPLLLSRGGSSDSAPASAESR
ncbi:hypothetical protein T484DRAFT_2541708 [Baffinella frigidus]|nr:hypothetical protein T484DRAFT_2541708 [Cryptophyta sp. CCMP2293]